MLVPSPPKSPDQDAPVADFSLLGTLQLWDGAKDELRPEEMRACLHDGAIVETVASQWRPVGADEAVEAIRTALRRDPFYLEGAWLYDELEPGVVLTEMPVRERSSSRGVIREMPRAPTGMPLQPFRRAQRRRPPSLR